jgi:hypothetical protein
MMMLTAAFHEACWRFGSRFISIMKTSRILHKQHILAGQTLSIHSGPAAAGQLLASISQAVDIKALEAGDWPILDDVHEHFDHGMIAQIHVSSH